MESVTFTAENREFVRQWVQDRSASQEIVATPTRLYLPVFTDNMVQVDPGDEIQWDPELPGPNAFSVIRHSEDVLP